MIHLGLYLLNILKARNVVQRITFIYQWQVGAANHDATEAGGEQGFPRTKGIGHDAQ